MQPIVPSQWLNHHISLLKLSACKPREVSMWPLLDCLPVVREEIHRNEISKPIIMRDSARVTGEEKWAWLAEKRRAKKNAERRKDGKKILGLSENEIQSESYFPGKSKLATDEKKKAKLGTEVVLFFLKWKQNLQQLKRRAKRGREVILLLVKVIYATAGKKYYL